MKTIKLEVITPSKHAFEGIVTSVTVPGSMGGFQVLYNHAPILSSLDVGIVSIKESNGNEMKFATGGGTVEVLNNHILLLVESFESPSEIDIQRAEKSMDRAKKRLSKDSNEEKVDMARAEVSLKRAINRLKLAGKTV